MPRMPPIAEMERQMGLTEDVLRFITIKVEEHDERPSAMMRKREDDERERGDRRAARAATAAIAAIAATASAPP